MYRFNSKGFQKYLIAGALIVLFLGTLAMTSNATALPSCIERIEYTCNAVETTGGTPADSWDLCTSLCIIDNEYAYLDAAPYFHCNLGFVNSKELLGSGASIIEGGCFVNLNGRSMTLDMVDEMDNSIVHLNCTPCNGCCPP